MSYRRRGGLNGRGAIIRPPGYRYNGLINTHIMGEETQDRLPNYGHVAEESTLNFVRNSGYRATASMLHHVPSSVIQATTSTTSHQAAASTNHTFHQATTNMTMEAPNTVHQLPNTVHQVLHQVPHTNPLHNANVGNNHEAITNTTDETGNPEKEEHVLHPDGLWFSHRAVVNKVSATSYKSYFKGPYCNWKMTPPQVQQRWWNTFKHEFSWDPSVAKIVKKGWKSKVSRRLTGIVSKVCNEPGYEAEWCPPTVREEMIRIRSEEENKKKSRAM
ncbi:uncharacterized protein [Spinacia oleracea]|nr:uncharacterized protein LOC110805981 isoform X2 [Spinacia oleracea]